MVVVALKLQMTFGTSVDKLTLPKDTLTRLKPPNRLGSQNVYLLNSQNFDLFAILRSLAFVDHGEKRSQRYSTCGQIRYGSIANSRSENTAQHERPDAFWILIIFYRN